MRLGESAPDGAALITAAEAVGIPMNVEYIPSDDAADLYQADLCLVRPDGHVAWRGTGDPDGVAAIIDTVRGVGDSELRTNAEAFAETGRQAA